MVVVALLSVDLVESVDVVSVYLVVNCSTNLIYLTNTWEVIWSEINLILLNPLEKPKKGIGWKSILSRILWPSIAGNPKTITESTPSNKPDDDIVIVNQIGERVPKEKKKVKRPKSVERSDSVVEDSDVPSLKKPKVSLKYLGTFLIFFKVWF